MELPQTVAGVFTGAVRVPPLPVLLPPWVLAGVQDALPEPIALPHTVAGAVTGASALVAPPLPLVPLAGLAAGVQDALPEPSSPTLLPHTVAGAVTGMLSAEPGLRAAELPAGAPAVEPADEPAGVFRAELPVDESVVVLPVTGVVVVLCLLNTDTVLPLTVTGVLTGMLARDPVPVALPVVVGMWVLALCTLWPSTVTVFPPRVIGALMGAVMGAVIGGCAAGAAGVAGAAQARAVPASQVPPANNPT
jgi:hypothetical protein